MQICKNLAEVLKAGYVVGYDPSQDCFYVKDPTDKYGVAFKAAIVQECPDALGELVQAGWNHKYIMEHPECLEA